MSIGKLKKRAAALKVVPCSTEQQRALLEREAANLRALTREEEGRKITATFAPAFYEQFVDVQRGQGILAMRSALLPYACFTSTGNLAAIPDTVKLVIFRVRQDVLLWPKSGILSGV